MDLKRPGNFRDCGLVPPCVVLLFLTIYLSCPVYASVSVCASGCDYSKIQDAIDHAGEGDEILVGDGVYEECLDIEVPVSLATVNGYGSTSVICSTGSAVNVYADNVNFSGFSVTGVLSGISLGGVSGCNISKNNVSNNVYDGIEVIWDSSDNVISGNFFSFNGYAAIRLHSPSTNTSVIDNHLYSNYDGMSVLGSLSNLFVNNTVYDCDDGLRLASSTGHLVINNTFIGCGLYLYGSSGLTVSGNSVNGLPLVYLEGESDVVVGDAGQVILVDCVNITVTGLAVSNSTVGIELWGTNESTVVDNLAEYNSDYGIYCVSSEGNVFEGNSISLNGRGGMHLGSSSNALIKENDIGFNYYSGLWITDSVDYSVVDNSFDDSGLYVYNSFNSFASGNSVNGLPLVYLEGESDVVVDDAGQVVLVDCLNVTVSGLSVSSSTVGIEFWGTNDSRIIDCELGSNTYDGIRLYDSHNNMIEDNVIDSNSDEGVYMYSSTGNLFIGNRFRGNEESGLLLEGSDDTRIVGNSFLENAYGVRIHSSRGARLTGNNMTGNIEAGVWFVQSLDGLVYMNNISLNGVGVSMDGSDGNTIRDNEVKSNGDGISISASKESIFHGNNISLNERGFYASHSCDGSSVYDNYFSNDVNAQVSSSLLWNSSGESGSNIMGGGIVGGNYWSDYGGADGGGDGIGDDPYVIDAGNVDHMPLVPSSGGCALEGDMPPCGVITMEEIADLVNLWNTGEAYLSDVLKLISGFT